MTGFPQDALAALAAAGAGRPALALVLGSGFEPLAESWPRTWSLPYGEVPGMPACTVEGHVGELSGAALAGGKEIWLFRGRRHLYEGATPEEVVRAVDLAAAAGVRRLLLTCAAGGIRPGLQPGTLALVSDHINLTGWSPPAGREPFVDLSQVYDATAGDCLRRHARSGRRQLQDGVLAAMRGPAYETPAEIRMLATLGADMVSMSTVPEAMRGRALGLQVAALACIANPAAGRGAEPLDHGAVLSRVGATVAGDGDWLLAALSAWAAGDGAA